MEYLLDTHLVYWTLYNKAMVPKEIVEIINDERNDIYVSAISIWEISLKHIKSPKSMPVSGRNFYQDCLKNNLYIIPFLAKEIIDYEEIRIKKGCFVNKDPFDRVLIAQAKHRNYMFCTCDNRINYYNDSHIAYYKKDC